MDQKPLPKCPYVRARNMMNGYTPPPDAVCPVMPHERRQAIQNQYEQLRTQYEQLRSSTQQVHDVYQTVSQLYTLYNFAVSLVPVAPPLPPLPELNRHTPQLDYLNRRF